LARLSQKSVNSLKILLYTPTPEFTGGFYRCFYLAKYIAQEGDDVTLACSNGSPTLKTTQKVTDGVRIVNLPMNGSLPGALLADIVRIGKHIEYQLSQEYDLVHVFIATIPSSCSLSLLYRALRMIRRRDMKLLVDWDDWWGRGGIWQDYNPVFHLIGTILEELPIRLADAVTVVSEPLRRRALTLGIDESRIFCIPNGSNVEEIQPLSQEDARKLTGLPQETNIITHVGFLDVGPFRILVEMFEAVHEIFNNSILVLVGKLKEKHLEIIQASRVRDAIRYFGTQPYLRVATFLAASDILCLSARDWIQEHSRFPIRLGDYLASGRPVVATNTWNVASILNASQCGLLVRPDDAEDFSAKVIRLLNDPDLRRTLGKNARSAAEGVYSWRLVSNKLRAVYQQL
jgi:glycosyltransferase involved in cell wall biosynthesis